MIRTIKLKDTIYLGLSEKSVDEDGTVIWNIPTDIEELKLIAYDTINWSIGNKVKKAAGGAAVSLSASNAKGIALLTKLIKPTQTQLEALTELERDSFDKMKMLADNGYADSQLLNTSLTKVMEFVAEGTERASRVATAMSIDEVIAVLNED